MRCQQVRYRASVAAVWIASISFGVYALVESVINDWKC